MFKFSCLFIKYEFYFTSCLSCLYILDINHLSDMWLTNTISHSVSCLFILLMVSLLDRSILVWCNPTLLFFILLLCFWERLKKKLSSPTSKSLLPMFSSRSFMVSMKNNTEILIGISLTLDRFGRYEHFKLTI